MQHKENAGGVQTQESMDNAQNSHNTLLFGSLTDLLMVVSIILLFSCVELTINFSPILTFPFVFTGF